MSALTKEELNVCKSLESNNQFTSGWVKEVKIKLFLNYLLKLPWLLDWSYVMVMYLFLHSSVRYQLGALCLLLQVKSRSARGASRHPALWAIARLLVTSVSPIYPLDEFYFLFLLFLPLRPTQRRAGLCDSVCVEFL